MTDREIVEWVARGYSGEPLHWRLIAEALHREIGFRMPRDGEPLIDWCTEAQRAAASAR